MPGSPSTAMRAALAGMLTMAVVMGIGRFVYTPILPSMLNDAALDASQAGMVAGANYLGYLLGALGASAGFFAPHRRLWIFLALAASVATTAAMGGAQDVTVMVAMRFLSGVASALSMVFVTATVLAKLAAERREGLIALHFGGVGLGIAGSAVLVSALVSSGVAWQGMWLASGAAAAVCLALVAWLLPPTGRESVPARGASRRIGAARYPLASFTLSYGLFGFGYVITATFINAMAKSEPALAPVEPYVWIAVGLAIIPSVWFWNRMSTHIGVIGAYALACLVEAMGVALSVTMLQPLVLLVSACLLGGTFVAITSLGLARARAMSPHNPAAAIAMMTASFGFGQMVGPVVAGWLFDRLGNLAVASWLAAAMLLAAAAFAILTGRFERMAFRGA